MPTRAAAFSTTTAWTWKSRMPSDSMNLESDVKTSSRRASVQTSIPASSVMAVTHSQKTNDRRSTVQVSILRTTLRTRRPFGTALLLCWLRIRPESRRRRHPQSYRLLRRVHLRPQWWRIAHINPRPVTVGVRLTEPGLSGDRSQSRDGACRHVDRQPAVRYRADRNGTSEQ